MAQIGQPGKNDSEEAGVGSVRPDPSTSLVLQTAAALSRLPPGCDIYAETSGVKSPNKWRGWHGAEDSKSHMHGCDDKTGHPTNNLLSLEIGCIIIAVSMLGLNAHSQLWDFYTFP